MRYISPILLLNLPAADTYEKRDLLIAKRRMLAELEMAGGVSLEVMGREMSKHEILQLFDQAGEQPFLSYHLAILADKGLSQFLAGNGSGESPMPFADNLLYNNADFIEWASPYYYEVFTYDALRFINFPDEEALDILLKRPLLMDYRHREMAWDKIQKTFEKKIDAMRALCDEPSQGHRPGFTDDMEALCDYRLVNMMLSLPEERFAAMRDVYAYYMMQLLIVFFNTRKRQHQQYALETMQNATILAVDYQNVQQIKNKSIEMRQLLHGETIDGKKEKSWPWTGIGFIVFLLFRFVLNCDNSSTNTSYNYPVTTYSPVYEKTNLLDSLPPAITVPAGVKTVAFNSFITALAAAKDSSKQGEIVHPQTGAEVYNAVWSQKVFAHAVKKVPAYIVKIKNRSSEEVILFVCNNNKITSTYIKPGKETYANMAEGENVICVYAGKDFTRNKSFTFNTIFGDVKVKGLFNVVKETNHQKLSESYHYSIGENFKNNKYLDISETADGGIFYEMKNH